VLFANTKELASPRCVNYLRLPLPSGTLSGEEPNYLYALDAKTGREKWKFNAECSVNSPVICDGVIYFRCGEHLYAVMSK